MWCYPTEGLALVNQALEIAPQEDSRVQSLIYFGLASVYHLMEDYARAVEAYQMAIEHGRAAANFVAEMMSVAGLSLMAFEHGQNHLAFEIVSQAIDRIERAGILPPISTVLYGSLGQIYYEWHQLDKARENTLRAIELSAWGGYSSGAVYCRVLLSRLLQIEGDLEAADQEIQKAVEQMQVGAPADVREEVVVQQVRVYLAQDRLAAAEMALQSHGFSFQGGFSFPDLPPGGAITHIAGLLYNSGLRVLLYRARARRELASLRPGIELADQLIARALQREYVLVALEALLLRAQISATLGNGETNGQSQVDYVRALELAEPEGLIGVFVEQGAPVAEALANLVEQDQLGAVQPDYVKRTRFIRSILAAFSSSRLPGPTHGGPAALIEPLTDRELDVLRSMAEGLKYKEIAARLFISLNTVRFHVKAIYGKLNVNNRTQAIEMARRLQLL
jgi:LuxR family maltose regulon positive regulatory protein